MYSHGGGVAAVLVAGADVGVVLLQHRGVAVTLLVLLPPAGPDHSLVTAYWKYRIQSGGGGGVSFPAYGTTPV